jgi:uncharacterized secreted protein with C-terminal beta-propeller domain
MFKPAYFMGVVAAAVIGAIFAQTPPTPTPNPTPVPITEPEKRLPTFQSCQDLRSEIRNLHRYTLERPTMDRMRSEGVKEFAPSSSLNYSPTNIQVEGIDEGDLVKTDGRFIYTFADRTLTITRATPPEEAEVVSTTDLEGLVPKEMLIDGDRLIILGERMLMSSNSFRPSGELDLIAPTERRSKNIVVAETWDLSDRTHPQRIRMTAWTGSLLSTRATNGFLYLAIRTQVRQDDHDPVPLFRDHIKDVDDLEDNHGFEPVADCNDIAYVEPIQSPTFITVAALSFHRIAQPVNQSVVLADGQTVYASPKHLYIAQTSYGNWREQELVGQARTTIVQFAFSRGTVRARGAVHIAGQTLNQFSMDERDGIFRIVTTREAFSPMTARATDLYLLDDNLERLGAVENIAPGEQFYAARFFGDRAYLVTFQVTDPLFVIDLADPRHPKVLGELEIPGYSSYLQPYDDTHLIGIGRNTTSSGVDEGLKFALFDVTDPTDPRELHTATIGDRSTTSPTLSDHKALLFDRQKDLFVVPLSMQQTIWIENDLPSSVPQPLAFFQGVAVYRLTLEKGFEFQTQISHETDPSVPRRHSNPQAEDVIQRSLWIDDALYTISDREIAIHDLGNFRELKRIHLSRDIDIPYIYPLGE